MVTMAVAVENKAQEVTLNASSETEIDDFLADLEPRRKMGTRADLRDMLRMGKKQELRRTFNFLSIVGFTSINMGTWESQIATRADDIANGGLAGMVWTYLVTFIGWCAIMASMAEIASIAPTSGGQYHWVSELAPLSISRILSYVTGWLSVLGWQMAVPAMASGQSKMIQSLLIINHHDFVFKPWQKWLVTITFSFASFIFNMRLNGILPLIGGTIVLFYIGGFFAILVTLWVLAPRNTAEQVFVEFTDETGWGNVGVSSLISTVGSIYSLMGPDSATHMAEEIKDSSLVLPWAMVTTCISNGVLGFVMLITFCYTLGDVDKIFSLPGVRPVIYVFFNATNSVTATVIMATILEITVLIGCITGTATASRQLFAFARDKGLPYSSWVAYVRPGSGIPLNAIVASFTLTIILTLVSLASSSGFNIIGSISLSGNLATYIICIACVRYKRWKKEPLPCCRWSLGRWGAPINDFSLLYLIVIFVIIMLPTTLPVTLANMNWTIVMFVFTIVASLVFFYFKGRYIYVSPVTLVRKDI